MTEEAQAEHTLPSARTAGMTAHMRRCRTATTWTTSTTATATPSTRTTTTSTDAPLTAV